MRAQWEIAEYLSLLWYRRRLFAVSALALFALGATVTFLIPSKYTATATLLFEQPRINVETGAPAPKSHTAAEIQATRARIMTLENLRAIVADYYPDVAGASADELNLEAAQLRDRIALHINNVDIVDQRTGHAGEATIGFAISFTHASPAVAYGIVDDVVGLFLSESASRRARGVAGAVMLLDKESRQLEVQIEQLESELATFKQQNVQSLPDVTDLKMTQLERFNRELIELQSRTRNLENRKGMREADLAMLSPKSGIYSEDGTRLYSPEDQLLLLQAELAAKSARYSPQHPDLIKLNREIAGLRHYIAGQQASEAAIGGDKLTAEEWEVLSRRSTASPLEHTVERGDTLWELARQYSVSVAELAGANAMQADKATLRVGKKLLIPHAVAPGAYTDAHPDVKRLARKIETGDPQPRASEPKTDATLLTQSLGDNPSFLRTRAEVNALARELDISRERQQELRGLIQQYEQDLGRVPEVERQLNEMLREYDAATAQLERIKEKQLDAVLAKAVDNSDAGNRFSLAEPVSLPARPDSPNRKVLLFFSLLLALACGATVILVGELRRAVMYDARGLNSAMNIRPLGVIPELAAKRRRRSWLQPLQSTINGWHEVVRLRMSQYRKPFRAAG